MATQDEIKQLAARSLMDAYFRTQLAHDPAAAAAQMNIQLTTEQIDAIKQASTAILMSGQVNDMRLDSVAKAVAGIWL